MKVKRWGNYHELEESKAHEEITEKHNAWNKPKSEEQLKEEFANFREHMFDPHSWEEYVSDLDDRIKPYVETLKEDILNKEIKEGGDWHQNADDGVPVFEDDTYLTMSYRAWGAMLAAIWNSTLEEPKYHYMDFYMSCLVGEREE